MIEFITTPEFFAGAMFGIAFEELARAMVRTYVRTDKSGKE